MLTFTAPWALADVPWTAPSAAYLDHIAAGLCEADRWNAATVTHYLGSLPGVPGHGTAGGAPLSPATPGPARSR